MKVHLISVVGKYVRLLPFMIEHYLTLGIKDIHIHVHMTSADDPVLGEVDTIMRGFGLSIASVCHDPTWIEAQNRIVRDSMAENPVDWFVIADQDELQHYPEDLLTVLANCDHEGYDHVLGCFVDRFGANGELVDLKPDLPLNKQFPIGAFFTFPITRGYPAKVVAAKGNVRLNGSGSHWAVGGRPCPVAKYHIPVHHFKWTAGLLDHLRYRVELYRDRNIVWHEAQRCVNYFTRNRGRVNLADPRIYAASCDPNYDQWHVITAIAAKWQEDGEILFPHVDIISAQLGPSEPIRLNVGGTSLDGYVGDDHGATFTTNANVSLGDMLEPAPSDLYQSCRRGLFSYAFPGLAPGSRKLIRLHFAETQCRIEGERRFHVAVNGKLVLTHLDVFQRAGGAYRAFIIQGTETVDEWGYITVDFVGDTGDAMVSGIEVLDT